MIRRAGFLRIMSFFEVKGRDLQDIFETIWMGYCLVVEVKNAAILLPVWANT